MRVVLGAVRYLSQRVLYGFLTCDGVELSLAKLRFLLIAAEVHHRLVDALPVVHVLTLAPHLLEGRLTLAYSRGVIEIPQTVGLLIHVVLLFVVLLLHVVAAAVLLHGLLRILLCESVTLLLLLALQFGDGSVDGSVAVLLVHLGKRLQRVLQVYGVGIWHQLVEHLRAMRQFLVVLTFLVQQSDGLAIASLCVVIALHLPIDVAQLKQEHALLDARPCGFGGTALVCADGFSRVVLRQIYVADGIIHLIQIFLVLVRSRHPLQSAHHFLPLSA